MSTPENNTKAERLPVIDPSRAAYDALIKEIEAVPRERLVSVNVDPQAAASIAIAAAPKIAAYRSQIADELPTADFALIDDILRRAHATEQAEALFEMAAAPKDDLPELVERATAFRGVLVSELTMLVRRGLVEQSRLAELGTTRGHKGIGMDVRRAAIVMRELLDSMPPGSSLTTREELEEAGATAAQLLASVTARENAPARAAAAAIVRRQALTYLFEAYDEARAAIAYLRRKEGDANEIAPTLFGTRDSSGRKKEEPEAAAPEPRAPLAQASVDRAEVPGFGESDISPFGGG